MNKFWEFLFDLIPGLFFFALFVMMVGFGHAAQLRVVDGKLEFAVATVNGNTAWSAKEKKDLSDSFGAIGGTAPVTTSDIGPSSDEVNLSTCVPSISTREEFLQCQTREGLRKKLSELRAIRDLAQDLGDTAMFRDARERFNWLRQFYQGLP